MFSRNKVASMSTEKPFLEDLTSHPSYLTGPQPTTISRNYVIYNNIRVSETSRINENYRQKDPLQSDSGHHYNKAKVEDVDCVNHYCCYHKGWFQFQESSDGSATSGIPLELHFRVLWLFTFGACLSVAAYMINEVWRQYYDNPVIVTFNPSEENIDSVPFPAVTVCNMNPFSKLRVHEFEKKYQEANTEEERKHALDALRVIYGICSTQPSFIKSRGFAKHRGFIMIPEAAESPSTEMDKGLTDFLLDNTQSCGQLLRLCEWESKEFDCEKSFRPILTDFGMCCTFNALPQQRMFKDKKGLHEASRFRDNPFWNLSEVVEWRKWKYENNLIVKERLKYPFRQQKAGLLNGLTLLVDPDVENSFCPSSDAEGVKILLHAPIEAARVADLGSIVGLNREVFLQVTPDVTISHKGILDYDHVKRNCYFGKEYKLKYYKPYTKANCQEECWNQILLNNCNCVMYHTPRYLETEVCSSNPNSEDYNCVKRMDAKYYSKMDEECAHCIYSCNNLAYTTEVTSARLQPREMLWSEKSEKIDNSSMAESAKQNNDNKNRTTDWMGHRISIVHIYMGSDTVVPKLRRKLYNTIDLIANTGGLLGLSLGFSILSAVEILYLFLIKLCKDIYRRCSRCYHNRVYLQNNASYNVSPSIPTKHDHFKRTTFKQPDSENRRLISSLAGAVSNTSPDKRNKMFHS